MKLKYYTNLPSPNLFIYPSIPNLSGGLPVPNPPILRLLVPRSIGDNDSVVTGVSVTTWNSSRASMLDWRGALHLLLLCRGGGRAAWVPLLVVHRGLS